MNSVPNPARPLEGVSVVELATLIAGPTIGMLLGDYGAEVVKVENPSGGDGLRAWGNRKDGVSLYHKVVNRNKRSVTADLRTPLGVEIVRRLARNADVVIENFRPGTLESWGLGYEELERINPRIVLVRVSGFGQTGPYRDRPGFGTLAEAMTGFAYTNGDADRPPLLPSFALADTSTGLAGAFLTLAALRAREHAGRGQVVDLAIYESLLTMLGPQVIDYDQLGYVQERTGSRLPIVSPRNSFRTRDGKWVAISAGSQSIFERLCRALDLPHLIADPRFGDNTSRREHIDALEEALQQAFLDFDQADILKRLEEHEAAAGPVCSVADVVADPHLRERRSIVSIPDEELRCDLRMQNIVGRLSRTPGAIDRAAAPLGADNRAILAGRLGFSTTELESAGLRI
ncbi:MAG: CoA transferase [Burkholderiales bacterium]|nr:CoA transferase [Burkholderiales bacterium]